MYQMLYALCLSTILTQRLMSHAIFGQVGPPQQVNWFAPLWEYWQYVSFPKTQQYIAQFRN